MGNLIHGHQNTFHACGGTKARNKKFQHAKIHSSYLQNLLFNCSSFYSRSSSQVGKISHKHLCRLCFTSTTLPTNQNWIAFSFINHCPILLFYNISVRNNKRMFKRWSNVRDESPFTCMQHHQQQKHEDLAPQMLLLYTVPSCECHTDEAIFEMD